MERRLSHALRAAARVDDLYLARRFIRFSRNAKELEPEAMEEAKHEDEKMEQQDDEGMTS